MDKQKETNKIVVETVWQWKQQENVCSHTRLACRRRSLLQFSITIIIASLLFFFFHHIVFGIIIYSLSFLVLLCGFFIPTAFAALDKLGRFLGAFVGRLLTYLLLVPFFYLCFFSGRLILKMLGKDPMKRTLEPNAATYWIERKCIEDTKYYKVQYR